MSQSKEKLEKFLKFIDEVANEKGNEWFKDQLRSRYCTSSKSDSFDDFDKEKSIQKIYEYCLKEIIRAQANKFYENFKYTEIKGLLIQDFIRMEHYRRQDDFENFCLAMFQQIENIVNHLTSFDTVKSRVFQEKDEQVVTKFDREGKMYRAGVTLSKLLAQYGDRTKVQELFSKELNQWYFNNKLRVVLFFFCFNSEIKYNTDEFERLYEMGNYIYQMRNLNHRGGIKSDYQKQIINKVLPSSQKYYLRFLGFLEEFVSSIDECSFKSYQLINSPTSNNVFTNSETLKKIREKLL